MRDALHAVFGCGAAIGGLIDIKVGPNELVFEGGDLRAGIDLFFHLAAGRAPIGREDDDDGLVGGFGAGESDIVVSEETTDGSAFATARGGFKLFQSKPKAERDED